jgi:tRNA A-37 threonylcarbamoyl transferase component Bud32
MSRKDMFVPAPECVSELQRSGLDSLEAWWTLALREVEPGNRRRGGWSQVFRFVLAGVGGVFVKRQEDHVYRSWRHPLRGRLTAEREFHALAHCREAGVAVTEPVLYACDTANGHQRGVLVTRALDGYRGLDTVTRGTSWPDRLSRGRLLRQTALLVRTLHAARLEHGCLYPKHVMVQDTWLMTGDQAGPPLVLIDLEKCTRRWRRATCRLRDLDSLNRRAEDWSRTDRRRFLGHYLAAGRRLDPAGRRLWRALAQRAQGSAVAALSSV